MVKRFTMAVLVLSAAALSLTTVGVSGQAAQPARPAAGNIPRTADGKPDFSGIWENLSKADSNIEPHSATRTQPATMGAIVGDALPYQPAALQKRNENFAKRATLDTESKCFLPGIPRIMYEDHPFQIVQTSDLILMLFEYVHATRNVYMNSPHIKGPLDWWMGDSRGKWDGDTLVIDANNFNEETWFDRAGNFHSDALHVVERYTRTSPDVIAYEATIEDAKTFTRPWKMSMALYRRQEKNAQLMDFKCPEFVEELLYGAWRKTPLAK